MIIFIDLRDDKDNSHDSAKFTLPSETTVLQLQELIVSSFRIAVINQRIFDSENRRIDTLEGTLEDIGLKDKKLILKHTHISVWQAYLILCEGATDTKKMQAERKNCAKLAMDQIDELKNSTLFRAYTKLVPQWTDTMGKIIRFFDRNALKQSATSFFTKLFPSSQITFEPKSEGTRSGIIVVVSLNGKVSKFFMKTYHHVGSSTSLQNTTQRHLPDLREMFAYRMMNTIGVGPDVFFPFYDRSTHIHYIATAEVKEFKAFVSIENIKVKKEIVVKAYMLQLILGVRDLNEENFGSSDNGIVVVDFYVPKADNFLQPRIFEKFLNQSYFCHMGAAHELLVGIEKSERIEIAKQAVIQWRKIKELSTEIIDNEKKELRLHGVRFGDATLDVEEYLSNIKSNYDTFCEALKNPMVPQLKSAN